MTATSAPAALTAAGAQVKASAGFAFFLLHKYHLAPPLVGCGSTRPDNDQSREVFSRCRASRRHAEGPPAAEDGAEAPPARRAAWRQRSWRHAIW